MVWARRKAEHQQKKLSQIFQLFFDKGVNASQAAKNLNTDYDSDTVTANFANYNSDFVDWVPVILLLKMHHALAGQLSNISIKIMKTNESDRYVNNVSIAKELKNCTKKSFDTWNKP